MQLWNRQEHDNIAGSGRLMVARIMLDRKVCACDILGCACLFWLTIRSFVCVERGIAAF